MIIIWAADRKALQTATICQELICVFLSYEVLLPLSCWLSPTLFIKIHFWARIKSLPTSRHLAERSHDFIHVFFSHPDQPKAELRNLPAWHSRGWPSHACPFQQEWEIPKNRTRQISHSRSKPISLEVLIISGLFRHLGLTLSLILSNPSLKYKECLVY